MDLLVQLGPPQPEGRRGLQLLGTVHRSRSRRRRCPALACSPSGVSRQRYSCIRSLGSAVSSSPFEVLAASRPPAGAATLPAPRRR